MTPYDGEQLKAAVATGPVGVAINGSSLKFQMYASGVFDCSELLCPNGESNLSHAVVLVGFSTTTDGVDYFILKN